MLDDLRKLLCDLFLGRQASESGHRDMMKRPLHFTPYTGGYDSDPVGWIVAVQGSPPKGVLMIHHLSDHAIRSYYQRPDGACRKLPFYGVHHKKVVEPFYRANLASRTAPFVLA